MDPSLNIGGSEWIIIIFAALVLILGTNRLPDAAKKLGRASAEYKRAKSEVSTQISEAASQNVNITGPVENERQKFEMIAKSLGIDPAGMSTDELRKVISDKIGQKGIDGEPT